MAFADKTTNKVPLTQQFIEDGLPKNAPVSSAVLNTALGYMSENISLPQYSIWREETTYKQNQVVLIFSYDTQTDPANPQFLVRHYLCMQNNKGVCPAGTNAKISQPAINGGFGDYFYDEYTIEANPPQWLSIWG